MRKAGQAGWTRRLRGCARRLSRSQGFTLIELAVALAILGIVIAAAVPTYLSVRNRACDAEAKQILAEARSLAWTHRLEHDDQWPQVIADLGYTTDPATPNLYQRGHWDFSLSYTSDQDPLLILATGQAGSPTDGRLWQLTLGTDGQGTLAGP